MNVLKGTLSRITNEVGKQRQFYLLNSEKPKLHCRRHRATPSIVPRIASRLNKENHAMISSMAARCHINVSIMFRTIQDIIGARWRKKRLVCRLYSAIIEKRRC